jgi:hypothetical protein
MDNPENLTRLGIQDKQSKNTRQKTKKMSNTVPTTETQLNYMYDKYIIDVQYIDVYINKTYKWLR